MNVFRFLCPLWARPPALSGTGPERSIFFALSVYSWPGWGQAHGDIDKCVSFSVSSLGPSAGSVRHRPREINIFCSLCLLLAWRGQAQRDRDECVSLPLCPLWAPPPTLSGTREINILLLSLSTLGPAWTGPGH